MSFVCQFTRSKNNPFWLCSSSSAWRTPTVADLHKSVSFPSTVICSQIRWIACRLSSPIPDLYKPVQREQVSQDFKRMKFVLNVQTDATDRKSKASHASYSSDNALLHQRCCIRSICFLFTLSFSIITEAPSLTLGQFKKLSRFTLHSVLHSKQHLTYNPKRSLLLGKVLSCMAGRGAIHVPLTRRIMKTLSYL